MRRWTAETPASQDRQLFKHAFLSVAYMVDISKLMAAINPDIFCQPRAQAKVKRELRDYLWLGSHLAYQKAAELTVPVEPNFIPLKQLEDENPFRLPGQRSPVQQHVLVLDRPEEPLEPIYFNLLDDLQQREDWRVTKLVDTVTGAAGAGLSTDLTRRVMQQQKHAAEQMSGIQHQIRALLHHWQKWREQKESLATYDTANGPDGNDKENALRILQHRWRRASDPELASDASKSTSAFELWHKHSEAETRRLLEIERQLLANELHLLKLQAAWLKPYLVSQQKGDTKNTPDLVMAFNTAVFELVLVVEPASEIELFVQKGELPKMLLGKEHRRPHPILLVELRFRAIPERTKGAAYAYRGRAELTFTSYALNDDELSVFIRELQRSEWGEIFGLLEQDSATNLKSLLDDLDELLAVEPAKEPDAKAESIDINPFSALFSIGDLFKSNELQTNPTKPTEPLKPDTAVEQVLRSFALLEARRWCQELYQSEKTALTGTQPLENS